MRLRAHLSFIGIAVLTGLLVQAAVPQQAQQNVPDAPSATPSYQPLPAFSSPRPQRLTQLNSQYRALASSRHQNRSCRVGSK